MTSLPRATEFELGPDASARLERLLGAEQRRVREACRGLALSEPACALAFIYTWEHDYPVASYTYVLTATARTDLIAALLADTSWGPAWAASIADWNQTDFLGQPDGETSDLAEGVAEALIEAGCEDPEGAFLVDLASRLSSDTWDEVMPTTDDFGCWVHQHDSDEAETFAAMAVTLPESVLAIYQERGWIED